MVSPSDTVLGANSPDPGDDQMVSLEAFVDGAQAEMKAVAQAQHPATAALGASLTTPAVRAVWDTVEAAEWAPTPAHMPYLVSSLLSAALPAIPSSVAESGTRGSSNSSSSRSKKHSGSSFTATSTSTSTRPSSSTSTSSHPPPQAGHLPPPFTDSTPNPVPPIELPLFTPPRAPVLIYTPSSAAQSPPVPMNPAWKISEKAKKRRTESKSSNQSGKNNSESGSLKDIPVLYAVLTQSPDRAQSAHKKSLYLMDPSCRGRRSEANEGFPVVFTPALTGHVSLLVQSRYALDNGPPSMALAITSWRFIASTGHFEVREYEAIHLSQAAVMQESDFMDALQDTDSSVWSPSARPSYFPSNYAESVTLLARVVSRSPEDRSDPATPFFFVSLTNPAVTAVAESPPLIVMQVTGSSSMPWRAALVPGAIIIVSHVSTITKPTHGALVLAGPSSSLHVLPPTETLDWVRGWDHNFEQTSAKRPRLSGPDNSLERGASRQELFCPPLSPCASLLGPYQGPLTQALTSYSGTITAVLTSARGVFVLDRTLLLLAQKLSVDIATMGALRVGTVVSLVHVHPVLDPADHRSLIALGACCGSSISILSTRPDSSTSQPQLGRPPLAGPSRVFSLSDFCWALRMETALRAILPPQPSDATLHALCSASRSPLFHLLKVKGTKAVPSSLSFLTHESCDGYPGATAAPPARPAVIPLNYLVRTPAIGEVLLRHSSAQGSLLNRRGYRGSPLPDVYLEFPLGSFDDSRQSEPSVTTTVLPGSSKLLVGWLMSSKERGTLIWCDATGFIDVSPCEGHDPSLWSALVKRIEGQTEPRLMVMANAVLLLQVRHPSVDNLISSPALVDKDYWESEVSIARFREMGIGGASLVFDPSNLRLLKDVPIVVPAMTRHAELFGLPSLHQSRNGPRGAVPGPELERAPFSGRPSSAGARAGPRNGSSRVRRLGEGRARHGTTRPGTWENLTIVGVRRVVVGLVCRDGSHFGHQSGENCHQFSSDAQLVASAVLQVTDGTGLGELWVNDEAVLSSLLKLSGPERIRLATVVRTVMAPLSGDLVHTGVMPATYAPLLHEVTGQWLGTTPSSRTKSGHIGTIPMANLALSKKDPESATAYIQSLVEARLRTQPLISVVGADYANRTLFAYHPLGPFPPGVVNQLSGTDSATGFVSFGLDRSTIRTEQAPIQLIRADSVSRVSVRSEARRLMDALFDREPEGV